MPHEQDQTTDIDTQDTTPTDVQETVDAPSMRGAPEEGLYDLTLDDETAAFFGPNGEDLNFDGFDQFSAVAAEMDLSQHAVDQLVGAYAGVQAKRAQEIADAVGRMVQGWQDDARADPEIGRANWQSSVDSANRVIQQFGTPELVNDVLVGQGIGNHPEMVRLLARIGHSLGATPEPKTASYDGPAPATDRDALASSMYSATTPSGKVKG
ncbi:MAG: hypothetical protein AAFO80_08265 [Pseudomonadota bacterium]